jgi:hypothetical protein
MSTRISPTHLDKEAINLDKRSSRGLKPVVLVFLLILSLGLTFWLYSQPEIMVMLAEQLWACF